MPWQRIRSVLIEYAEWWIISVGVILRLKHYFENRSLWLDEACAAVSVTSRSYSEIVRHFEVMPEFAHPPMGFMLVEKFFTTLGGDNEMALRFFPLVCGILSLVLFFVVLRKFLPRRPLLLALALFAILEPLVYYSAELKQYSTDLLATIFLLGYADGFLKEPCGWGKAMVLGVIGAVILWFSNSAVFVLAGFAGVLLFKGVTARRWAELFRLAVAFAVWLVNFLAIYWLSLGNMVGNQKLKNTWEGALYKGRLFSAETFTWLGKVIGESFRDPVGLAWPAFGVALFVIGLVSMARKDRARAALYVLPLLLTLLAALLGKYPFRGRVILFLLPCFILPLTYGVTAVAGRVKRFELLVVTLFAALLLAYPAREAGAKFVQGRDWVENRQAMEFFRDHYEPGDLILMNTSAQPPFWYYAQSLGSAASFKAEPAGLFDGQLTKGMKIAKIARDIGSSGGHRFIAYRYEYNLFDARGGFRRLAVVDPKGVHIVWEGGKIEGLPSGRVWLIVSKPPEDDELEIGAIARGALDRSAKRLMTYERKNAFVYLYDIPGK